MYDSVVPLGSSVSPLCSPELLLLNAFASSTSPDIDTETAESIDHIDRHKHHTVLTTINTCSNSKNLLREKTSI